MSGLNGAVVLIVIVKVVLVGVTKEAFGGLVFATIVTTYVFDGVLAVVVTVRTALVEELTPARITGLLEMLSVIVGSAGDTDSVKVTGPL
jgi:hypothetical protein